jgi:carbon monoxide dehydrogenase subunit G
MLALPRRAARCAAVLLLALSGLAFAAEPAIVVAVEKTGDTFVVDASVDLPIPVRVAWGVLTDFDSMASILNNLQSSRIVHRAGNTLQVAQEGTARFGIFSYTFQSMREIRLEPMQRIIARQLSGTASSFTSETTLSESRRGTLMYYHAEIVPGSAIARTFGGPFIRHEVEEQLGAMAAEMARRVGL